MKTIRYILITLAAILGLAALAACPQPVTPAGGTTGRVLLSVSAGAPGAARTILPAEVPAFSRYELDFTGGPISDILNIDPTGIAGDGFSQELAAGTWTATVRAYRHFTPLGGSEYLAAQGSAPVTVVGGTATPVTVNLEPVQHSGAKGIFTYTVTFPGSVTTATLTLTGGSPPAIPSLTSSDTPVSIELDPGEYDLFISLIKTVGSATFIAGASEKVHIYSGLESKAVYAFTDTDFAQIIPLAGTVDLNGAVVTAGNIVVYNADPVQAGSAAIPAGETAWTLGVPTQYAGQTLYFNLLAFGSDGKVYSLTGGDTGGPVPEAGKKDITLNPTPTTPTALAEDAWTSGATISSSGEVDWYTFTAAAGTYSLQWDDSSDGTSSYTGNVRVAAYRSSSMSPLFYADDGYTNPQSISVSANETIYIQVEGEGGNTGTYALKYYLSAPAAGGALTYNTWAGGTISSPGESHEYTFTPASAGTYYVQWDDSGNGSGTFNCDVKVSAYRAGETPVFTSQDSGYTNPRSVSVTASETIYIRVEGYNSGSTGTYALRYYDPSALPPQVAPLNVRVQATPAPSCIITWGSVSGATGYKVYRSTSSGGPFTTPVATIGDQYSYTDTGVTAGTTYYYTVAGVNAIDDGPLFATPVSDTPPVTAGIPNLSYDTWTAGTAISTAGEVDWYTFTPASAGTYYVQWDDSDNGSGTFNCDVKVSAYRAGGIPVFTNEDRGYTNPRSVSVTASETIYIRVEGYNSGSTGTYALRYYNPSVLPPQAAPLNVRVQATPAPSCIITWDSVSGATGYKVYRSTSSGGPFTTPVATIGDQYSYTDTGVTAGTTYYYTVAGVNAIDDGPLFATPVSDTPPVTASIPNLSYNDWTAGTLSTAGEVDWYRFTPASAGTYYVQWDDSDHSSGKGDVVVSAYRAAGTPVFTRLDARYDNPPSVSVTASETLYIRVEGYSGASTGDYAVRYYQ